MIPNSTVDVKKIAGGFEGEKIKLTFDENSIQHLMQVLTNMYKDTVMAPVREYSTNALDAQREAGYKGPIEVTPPRVFNNFFKVRDFGRGLSVEAMREVYSKYGASTKRESNAYNGTLGIGSKSGLTYTPSFTVTSFNEGMKHIVEVGIDDDGGAYLNIISSTPTTEHSGIEVKIPVRSEDVSRFRRAIQGLFQWWNPADFKIIDESKDVLTVREAKKTLTAYANSDKIYLRNIGKNSDPDLIVMGNVAYPSPFKNVFSGTGIVYFADIGEAVFAPSREALMTVEKNRKILEHCKKEIVAHLREQMDAELGNAKNILHAFHIYDGKIADLAKSVYGSGSGSAALGVEYKGTKLEDHVQAMYSSYLRTSFMFFKSGERSGSYWNEKAYKRIPDFRDQWAKMGKVSLVIVNAPESIRLPTSATNTVASRGIKALGLDSHEWIMVSPGSAEFWKTATDCNNELQVVEWDEISTASRKSLLASRPKVKRAPGKPKVQDEYQVFRLYSTYGDTSLYYSTEVITGDGTGFCYITREEFRNFDQYYTKDKTSTLGAFLKSVGLRAILIPPSGIEKLKKSLPKVVDMHEAQMILLDKQFEDFIKAMMKDSAVTRDDALRIAWECYSGSSRYDNKSALWVSVMRENDAQHLHDKSVLETLKVTARYNSARNIFPFHMHSDLSRGLPKRVNYDDIQKFMESKVPKGMRSSSARYDTALREIQEKYPLLRPVTDNRYDSVTARKVTSQDYVNYVNMVYNVTVAQQSIKRG